MDGRGIGHETVERNKGCNRRKQCEEAIEDDTRRDGEQTIVVHLFVNAAKDGLPVSPEISPGGPGRSTHNTRVLLRDVAKRSGSRYWFWVPVPIALSSRHRCRDKSRGGECS